MLEIRLETMSSLDFCWVSNHIFSYFPFWTSTLNIANIWHIQFWVKKVVEYWWGNNMTTLNYCVFSNWIMNSNHIFWLFMIIENLGIKKIYNEKIVWSSLQGWKHTMRGHFGHFHDIYVMYIFTKRVAFNFGFHFWCLGLIFWFSKS